MKYTGCFSRMEIEQFIPPGPDKSVLISIRDPDTRIARVARVDQGWRAIFFFPFWDLDKPFQGLEPASEGQLKELKFWLDRFSDFNIFANCEAGISRSGAIREYLVRRGWQLYDKAQEARGIMPNAHILSTLERLDRESSR